jgi:hypothetical protein
VVLSRRKGYGLLRPSSPGLILSPHRFIDHLGHRQHATRRSSSSIDNARLADLAKPSDRRILCSAAAIDRVLCGRSEATQVSAPADDA